MKDEKMTILVVGGVPAGNMGIIAALQKEGHTVITQPSGTNQVEIGPAPIEERVKEITMEFHCPEPETLDCDYEKYVQSARKAHLKQCQPWKRKKKGKQ